MPLREEIAEETASMEKENSAGGGLFQGVKGKNVSPD